MSFYPSTPMGKKTPYYKYKEKEKDKQKVSSSLLNKREEDESAKLYQHFVESFETGPESSHTTFVRGETIMPGTTSIAPEMKSEEKRIDDWKPSPVLVKQRTYSTASLEGSKSQERQQMSTHIPIRKPCKGKPKHIDIMLENIKREQEERASRSRLRKTGFDMMTEKSVDIPSSSSISDVNTTTTTNLYVGGLAPDLTEDILKREFAKFGAIASVKIMWPRDEDQVKRGSNVGFVAFMERDCAAKCIEKLNGEKLHGMELRIGWGKSVPLPSVPLFSSTESQDSQFPSSIMETDFKQPLLVPSKDSYESEIKVVIPEDVHLRYIIDTLAAYVLRDGLKFEQQIKRREANNPIFSFLLEDGSPSNTYYRWKLFSLAQGDSMKCWRLEPFYLIEDGAKWIPPTMCIGDGSQLTAAQKGGECMMKKKLLSEMERDKFKDMLKGLIATNPSICDAMVFALNNAEAAEEIVDILGEFLCDKENCITLQITLLFLVSDILHNSSASVRNASQYRSRLQEKLPDVFENFQEVYSSLHDKKDIQETVKKYVLRVLRNWRSWFIFSNDYLNGLQSTFLASVDSIQPDLEYLKRFQELQSDEIERKCRYSGLSLKGGTEKQILRLAKLETYLQGNAKMKSHKESKSSKMKQPLKRQSSSVISKKATGERKTSEKKLTSAWTSVKAEQSSRVPVSQWLQQKKNEKVMPILSTDSKERTESQQIIAEEKDKKVATLKEDFDMFEEEPDRLEMHNSSIPSDPKRQKLNDATQS